VNWKIYYGDGSVFSQSDGTPADAPPGNVMCVVWYDEDNRRKIAYNAYAYCYDGYWMGCDDAGYWQYMLEKPGAKIVKFGRMNTDNHFREIMQRAHEENPLAGAA
jgi:hypothetical protein